MLIKLAGQYSQDRQQQRADCNEERDTNMKDIIHSLSLSMEYVPSTNKTISSISHDATLQPQPRRYPHSIRKTMK